MIKDLFSFLIKDFKVNSLQDCSNLSWSLFKIPVSIPKSPMKTKVLYDSLALLSKSDS